jgi:hypothetical protein
VAELELLLPLLTWRLGEPLVKMMSYQEYTRNHSSHLISYPMQAHTQFFRQGGGANDYNKGLPSLIRVLLSFKMGVASCQ